MQEYFPHELSVFDSIPTILSVSETQEHELAPLNSIDSGNTIEFLSQPYSDRFKDLSSVYLQLRLKVVKNDGTDYKTVDTTQGRMANNVLFSLFESAYVYLNNTLVNAVDANFGYKEYWEVILNHSAEVSAAKLMMQGFDVDNEEKRMKALTADSKTLELYGKVNICSVSKLLIPGVSFGLKLNRAVNNYFLIESAKEPSLVKLLSAKLFVRHVVVKDDLLGSTEKFLSKHNAIYEFKRSTVISVNLPANTSNLNIPNIYHGRKPNLVGFTIVKNSEFTGTAKNVSPFIFKPHGLKQFAFTVNNEPKPLTPFHIVNSTTESGYARAFSSVYKGLSIDDQDRSNLISFDNFLVSHFMLIQDLTPFHTGLAEVNNLSSSITLGVTGTFAETTKDTLTCLILLVNDSRFEIAGDRSVKLLY